MQQDMQYLRYGQQQQQKPMVDMSMYSELFPNYSAAPARLPQGAGSAPSSGMSSPNSTSPASTAPSAATISCDSDSDHSGTTNTSASRSMPQRAAAGLQRMDLADLRHFPSELADPARLLLVSCSDPSKAHLYACRDCTSEIRTTQYLQHGSGNSCTVWALSFHHRHAFCTGCGEPASTSMPAKQFAELFMAAAAAYLQKDAAEDRHPQQMQAKMSNGWWVGADSSCSLRLLNGIGADACTSCSASSHQDYDSYEDDDEDQSCRGSSPNVWAVNSVYSHAFCTRCGHTAEGGSLVSLLLAIRFGGKKLLSRRGTLCPSNSTRSGKSTHGRESNVSVPTRRPASFR